MTCRPFADTYTAQEKQAWAVLRKKNPELPEQFWLTPEHERKLADSGISRVEAAVAGIFSASAETAKALTGHELSGLIFSYFDAAGRLYFGGEGDDRKPFFRLRPDDGSRAKYLSPKGAPIFVYLPRTANHVWQVDGKFVTGKRLVVSEGEFKSLCATLNGFPCIGLGGVSSYATGVRGEDGKRELGFFVDELDLLSQKSLTVVFDSDIVIKEEVAGAIRGFAAAICEGYRLKELETSQVPRRSLRLQEKLKYSLLPNLPDGKVGLDDALVRFGVEPVRELIEAGLPLVALQISDHDKADLDVTQLFCAEPLGDGANKKKSPYNAQLHLRSLIGWLTMLNRLAIVPESGQQHWYDADSGIWRAKGSESLSLVVEQIADLNHWKNRTAAAMGQLKSFIGSRLAVDKERWDRPGYLPFTNGVLDIQTKELLPHAPGQYFRWQLPYNYDPHATCELIQDWLLESMEWHEDRVQLLRAYLNAIVTGRIDLQRFMECLGPGGTGKSTFANLAIALIGLPNVFSTELKNLEQNRFEVAGILGKRLVLVSDSERYGGSIATLKALTGGDLLRCEQKYKQQGDSFIPQALVLICANEAIQSSDYTSGLQRRRLTVPFMRVVQPHERRDLISISHSKVGGEFAPHLPGLLNWVLDMPTEQVNALVRDTERAVPSLSTHRTEALLQSNPLSEWLDSRIVFRPGARTQVGIAKKRRITKADPRDSYTTTSEDCYENEDIWLYANYVAFVSPSGTKPVALRRFSQLLEDLCRNQLKLEVRAKRDSQNAYFEGLAIRGRFDESASPLLVSMAAATTSLENEDDKGGGKNDKGGGKWW